MTAITWSNTSGAISISGPVRKIPAQQISASSTYVAAPIAAKATSTCARSDTSQASA